MSAEMTLATEKAADALYGQVAHVAAAGGASVRMLARKFAATALTAALPTGCHEAVVPEWADGEEMPCEAAVVGYRYGEGEPYPVCEDHMRAPMATLHVALLGADS
jgi:hypothetical protein